VDHLEEYKQDVVIAAEEEREAHRALIEGRNPLAPDWTPGETEAYRSRLGRWQSASRALVDALDRLERAQRGGAVRPTTHGDGSS
jgi:uncharacterized protein YukE